MRDFSKLNGYNVKDAEARNRIDKLTLHGSTLISKKIRSYTYDDMVGDIEKLRETFAYNPYFRVKVIGKSVKQHDLYVLEYGHMYATRHLFVFNGFHAKDTSASICLAQLETLLRNDEYHGLNIKEKILGVDTCVHVIPMANPDGYMLGHPSGGYAYFAEKGHPITSAEKDQIETWIVDYIRNHLKNDPSEIGSAWDAGEIEDLESYIVSLGGDPSLSYSAYQFREKDLHIFASNIHGIDLHYNWYTDDMKNTVQVALEGVSFGHPQGYIYGAYGATPYVDENAIYKSYIDSYNPNTSGVHMSFLNFHQKGPTVVWNYRLNEVGDSNTAGELQNRAFNCGNSLAQLTSSPYSRYVDKQSTPVGFSAWATRYIPEPWTLSMLLEIGWKTRTIRGDGYSDTANPDAEIVRSPVPDWQWQNIYDAHKEDFLHMVRYYSSCRDVCNRNQNLNEYNFAYKITDETRFGVPSMQMMREYGYYKAMADLGVEYTTNDHLTELVNSLRVHDHIHNLTYIKELRCQISSSSTVAKKCFASWFINKNGSMRIYPVGECVYVDFVPVNTSLLYRKIYTLSDEVYTGGDWINITYVSHDPANFGVTNGMTLTEAIKKVPDNHILHFYCSSSYNINCTDIVSDFVPSSTKYIVVEIRRMGKYAITTMTRYPDGTTYKYLNYPGFAQSTLCKIYPQTAQ